MHLDRCAFCYVEEECRIMGPVNYVPPKCRDCLERSYLRFKQNNIIAATITMGVQAATMGVQAPNVSVTHQSAPIPPPPPYSEPPNLSLVQKVGLLRDVYEATIPLPPWYTREYAAQVVKDLHAELGRLYSLEKETEPMRVGYGKLLKEVYG